MDVAPVDVARLEGRASVQLDIAERHHLADALGHLDRSRARIAPVGRHRHAVVMQSLFQDQLLPLVADRRRRVAEDMPVRIEPFAQVDDDRVAVTGAADVRLQPAEGRLPEVGPDPFFVEAEHRRVGQVLDEGGMRRGVGFQPLRRLEAAGGGPGALVPTGDDADLPPVLRRRLQGRSAVRDGGGLPAPDEAAVPEQAAACLQGALG